MAISTSYTAFKARLVMGSLTQLKTTDHEGKPEANENKHHWFMGFAIPKGAAWDTLWNEMYNAASNDPSCTAALCGQAGFNWKTDDCDAPENPSNLGKASYPAGHMLIKFTRYKLMGPASIVDGNYSPILNPAAIKRGDYFYISAFTKFNGAATVKTNAGMYQNIEGLMFAEVGEEIVSEGGFSAKSAFAGLQGGQVVNGGVAQAGPQGAPAAQAPPAAQAGPQGAPGLDTSKPPMGAAGAPGLDTSKPPMGPAGAPPPPATDLVTPGAITTPPPVVPVEDSYTYSGVTKTLSEWNSTPGWEGDLVIKHGVKV